MMIVTGGDNKERDLPCMADTLARRGRATQRIANSGAESATRRIAERALARIAERGCTMRGTVRTTAPTAMISRRAR